MTTPAPTTTTQPEAPAPPCVEQPDGYDGAACRIETLTATLGTSSPDALGGKATAKRLNLMLARANRFLDSAQVGSKVAVNLRRARRELKVFERTVEKALRRKRDPIDAELGRFILGLAQGATSQLVVLQTNVR